MAQKIALIALAGACGTLARYGLSGLVHRWLGGSFPWGTAFVNVAGCLLFGIVWAAGSERAVIPPEARIIILTGFMGAFTTFSTFISESSQFLAANQIMMALLNMGAQLTVGTGAFFLGLALGRII